MQQYSDIIIAIITFIGGAGLQWLMNLRANRRQVNNKVAVEEFNSFQTTVESYMHQIDELMDKYKLLQNKFLDVSNELNKEQLFSNSLRKELNNLLNECNCDKTISDRIRREFQL